MAEKLSFELWRFLKASETPGVTRYLNTWSKWYRIVTVRPGGRTVPKTAVQWTVRRSLMRLDGTGWWTVGRNSVKYILPDFNMFANAPSAGCARPGSKKRQSEKNREKKKKQITCHCIDFYRPSGDLIDLEIFVNELAYSALILNLDATMTDEWLGKKTDAPRPYVSANKIRGCKIVGVTLQCFQLEHHLRPRGRRGSTSPRIKYTIGDHPTGRPGAGVEVFANGSNTSLVLRSDPSPEDTIKVVGARSFKPAPAAVRAFLLSASIDGDTFSGSARNSLYF
ncbi:hypothetical protein K438DRAFT_1770039 [Mycena galopus ATCC 62051]|nr:hypothetical protein K438DRAFT_1770039 [Mycena galopus ATCC 62051]